MARGGGRIVHRGRDEYVAWDTPGLENPVSLAAGGDSEVSAAGFAFVSPDGEHIAGPLMSVLAVDRTA